MNLDPLKDGKICGGINNSEKHLELYRKYSLEEHLLMIILQIRKSKRSIKRSIFKLLKSFRKARGILTNLLSLVNRDQMVVELAEQLSIFKILIYNLIYFFLFKFHC